MIKLEIVKGEAGHVDCPFIASDGFLQPMAYQGNALGTLGRFSRAHPDTAPDFRRLELNTVWFQKP
jgi:hypothetical protein